MIRLLRAAGYDETIYVHGAIESLNALYERFGVALGPVRPATVEKAKKADFAGAVVIAPPSSIDDRWSRRSPIRCLPSPRAGCACAPAPASARSSCRW